MMRGLVAATAVATLISSVALSQEASRGTASIPDLSGTWVYPFCCGFIPPLSGPGPVINKSRRRQIVDAEGLPIPNATLGNLSWIGDYTNPILKAAAAEAVKKKGELEDSGMTAPTPRNQCWPEGVPFIFDNMGIQILRQPGKITILYEHDHQVRQIRLNQVHPAQVSPSWYGDSVGHYEADTLVIDTVGFKIGPFSMVDWYGVPYTEALHVTEHYRLVDDDEAVKNAEERGTITNNRLSRRASAATGIAVDRNYKGKVLQLQFTVEDQGVFTMPWSASVIYRRSADEWPEHVCAENPRRSPATPTAAEADF
jgi:hypothetical protein